MLSGLFQSCLVGWENCDPSNVANLPAGLAETLERAILKASDLLNGASEDADSSANVTDTVTSDEDTDETEDDQPPAEHSVMSGEEADKHDQVSDELDEFTEADLMYQLHEMGYTYPEISQLIIPELDELMDGLERSNQRQKEKQEEAKENTSNGSTPGKGATGGGTNANMQGNRGGAHGDILF